MVSEIYYKIKHILEVHIKDINLIKEGQSKTKIKDVLSRKGNPPTLLGGM